MFDQFPLTLQQLGSLGQMATAVIALVIGIRTARHNSRQTALALINQNNTLANQVNTTIIQSEAARDALGRLNTCIVGCPDDAVLLMYLNYVHNTFRMRQARAVSPPVWQDTLAGCVAMVAGLRREQLERLLSRGYEGGFQSAVLSGFDAAQLDTNRDMVTTLTPRTRRSHVALVS